MLHATKTRLLERNYILHILMRRVFGLSVHTMYLVMMADCSTEHCRKSNAAF